MLYIFKLLTKQEWDGMAAKLRRGIILRAILTGKQSVIPVVMFFCPKSRLSVNR